MEFLIIIAIIAILVVFAVKLIEGLSDTAKNKYNEFPYVKVPLLTAREHEFYKYLKPIAYKYSLEIFIKVRIWDIIEVKKNTVNKVGYENRIKSKHIDFVLCNKDLEIITAIELDDKSHQRASRIKRDDFLDNAFKNAKINLVHINNFDEINHALSKISSCKAVL